MQYFPTSATRETDNYPYGRLRTKAIFGTEFKPRHGFRSTFQTVNPKTGKLNKPKFGTYYTIAVLRENEEGRIGHTCIGSPSGRERMQAAFDMLAKHWELFTDEERKHIAKQLHMHAAVDLRATVLYAGTDRDKTTLLYQPCLDVLKSIMQNGIYAEPVLDWDAIEALKPDKYSPFVLTETQIIG